jgi:hypothetical protein
MSDVRLIDANALDFALVDEYITDKSQTAALTGKGRCIFNAAIDIARCRVGDAPTIDATPARHGEWRIVNVPKKWGGPTLRCSECNTGTTYKWNYCPNCGAKMDGGAENV